MPRETVVRALHCADLHLHHVQPGHATEVVRGLRVAAQRHAVDVVLIAGDVFDTHAQPDGFVEGVAEELARLEVPLVAIPGNHDIDEGTGSRPDGHAIGRLFALLDGEARLLDDAAGGTALVADGRVRVWGRGMPAHTPENDPLAGLAAMPADGRWNVVMAHGQLTEVVESGRSSPIALDRYAAELRHVHYVALGHRHQPTAHRVGATPAHYSGSASTVVGPGTIAVAEFDGTRTAVHTHPLEA